jgi:hypothetical protein
MKSIVLLVLVLVLIDARNVKNIQVRARRNIQKAHAKELPAWCAVAADVKAKVAAETTRCEFFIACVKAAVASSVEDTRCSRLAALGAADGLGQAGLASRDLYLLTVADKLVPIISGAEDEATKATKVTECVEATRKDNFGTAGNNGAAPPAAPETESPAEPAPPSDDPPALMEQDSEEPKPVAENNVAPTFCACPRAEQVRLMTAWMENTTPPTPIAYADVEAKLADLNCPGGNFADTLRDELTAWKAKLTTAYEGFTNWASNAISGFVDPTGATPQENAATTTGVAPDAELL